MMRLIPIVAAVALFTGPALAAPDASTPVVKTDAALKERLVCKTSNQIGSRLRKTKSCRTAREWADMAAQTKEDTRDYQRVGLPGDPTTPVGK